MNAEAMTLAIVEDEWLVRTEIAEEAEQAGWTVREFATAESALRWLASDPRIDALITDIRLGGLLTGWEVAEAFRALFPALPVVYASANPPEDARMVPGGVFFTKPCRPRDILATFGIVLPGGPAPHGRQ